MNGAMRRTGLNHLAGICVMVTLLTGCSTIRMKYSAPYEAPGGKTRRAVYEKGYPVGGIDVLCPLTAVFFGGACWFYTVMPTVRQKNMIRADATIVFAKKLPGARIDQDEEVIESTGYTESDPRFSTEESED